MPQLRVRASACALGVALSLIAGTVGADWPLRLSGPEVTLLSSNAPESDASGVRSAVASDLAGNRTRLDRCLSGIELREDPLRNRERALSATLTFSRSARGTIQVNRSEGVPPAAVSCVREILQSARARPTPRGDVVIRVRYRIH